VSFPQAKAVVKERREVCDFMASVPRESQNVVIIRYTNYRGETSDRRIIPIGIRFGSSEWHAEEQWLLDAFDLDRRADRSFALKDVLQWRSDSHVSGRPRYQASVT
jgi:predicted DNA-binding transcriptional regulator YafY